jgi:hypothetical protein
MGWIGWTLICHEAAMIIINSTPIIWAGVGCSSHEQDIFAYNPKARAALAYQKLIAELFNL